MICHILKRGIQKAAIGQEGSKRGALVITDSFSTFHQQALALSRHRPAEFTAAPAAAASAGPAADPNALFRGRPQPLGWGADPKVDAKPQPTLASLGLRLLGFYGRESRLIRCANALYQRISERADDEAFLAALGLEKNFRATHAMFVLHLWLCLVRLRAEGKDGAEVGQTMYDLFNHDFERRVAAAGVKVLISKWMRELEKNFYGAVLAYDNSLKPSAPADALPSALWRNVFAEDGSEMPTGPDLAPVQALARYVRKEAASLALTGSEAFMTGNIRFSGLFRGDGESLSDEERA